MGRHGATMVGLLDAARSALSSWRREFGGRGRPIPARLWAMAAAAAQIEGVPTTARVLKVDARRLAAHATKAPRAQRPPARPAFVELPAMSTRVGSEAIVLELSGRDDERLRVELPARVVGAAELVLLARAFWSRGA